MKTGGDFDFSIFAETFDYVIAVSLFTHLPFNHIRVCLERLAPKLEPGGMFLATYFEIEEGHPSFEPKEQQPGGVVTQGERDPYHYYLKDFRWATRDLPWRVYQDTSFKHPRGQQLVVFERTS